MVDSRRYLEPIAFVQPNVLAGMIILWAGAVVDIPSGFVLCDGTNGTPDLRDRFVVGSGTTYNPGDSGGNVNHQHTGTTDGHSHSESNDVLAGTGGDTAWNTDQVSSTETDTITTDNADGRPPYYSLAYIMKT